MPRSLRVLAPALLLAATIAALFLGLAIGGAANPRALADPGTFVRIAVPLTRTLVNVAMAGLIGSVVMAIWALASDRAEARTALDVAAGSAAMLTVASAATLLVTYVDLSGLPFSGDAAFGAGLAQFVTEIELGRLWLIELLLAAATTVMAFAIRDRRLTLLVLLAALTTTLPLALQGHAAGSSNHSQAVNSLLVHLIGAAVWLGGLLTLVFLARVVDRQRLSVLTARYSTLALFAFVGVAASGVVSGWMRVGNLDALFGTGYGQLLMWKTGALLALGVFGAVQRTRLIPRIADSVSGQRAFIWFVLAELAVMGLASGIAGALGRTATPVSFEPARDQGGDISPAEWLTGDPLPPELTPMSYLTEWKFDLAWVLVSVFGLALYLAGVIRLKRRGDSWPIGRTIAWALGLIGLFYTTNGALNAYEQYLFSVHMLAHMMLTMLIPLLLVLGAPMTLALRTIEKRTDGSWGGREWIMWAIQTPYSKVITHPAVAAVVFAGSLWVFYFTPIARWAASEHLGHQWMIIHFLIAGYLFSLSMIGVDPVPYRFPYPLRLVTLFATMASHAFFGVTIMTGDGLMLADWYGAMGRTWGATPIEDQAAGGGIAWGIGELPTLALALVVAVQWSRSDTKEQKRKDRAADRSGEAELHAYNEMLAAQAERDAKVKR
ncbi:cytochrome c oxidase assembly protein [Leucobacter chromiireducens]|uniref:Copper transporter n=1 Tax=Leucobacter chromiireducens subsp. solipictus TaxID=398235 RepID=A0ABS1SIM9_9MICO|nr:copper transporter [Leucobacter chromiireducens subsp. solipictus]